MGTVQSGNEWLDRFFEHYYRVNPVSATFVGVHEHDSEQPRHLRSRSGDAVEREIDELLGDLDNGHVETSGDVAQQLDLMLARSYLRTARDERQSEHLSNNPCLYTGEAIFGIVSLFLRDFASIEVRLTHAADRLREIPRVLEEGESAVEVAPEGWVERAIRECDGAERLLREGLPILLATADATPPDIDVALAAALDAFADYRRQLTQRGASSDARYSVGQERFDWLLREAHFLDMTGDQIVDYARGELELARSALSSALTDRGFAGWQPVAELLAADHPAAEAYLGQFQAVWDAARQHAIDHELLTWPDFPIVFEPIPEWARAAQPHLYFLYYRCPPPFDDGQTQRYLVPPIDHLMPEQQLRILRAVNNAQITMNHVIHHAGIGHHVQNWQAARASSRIGQMAGNDCSMRIAIASAGTLVEGWACYATDLMEESGFLSPLQQLSTLHARMRMAARAIVDVELHSERYSLEDAVAFYVGEVDMTPEASQAEAIKNSMFPTMAMMYLIGTDLIHDLRADMRQQWGSEFSLRRFHDEFLSWGAIPVTLIGRLMRGESLEAGGFSSRHRG